MVDLDVVEDATAALLAAATDVSSSTRGSYGRRWRMWEGFPLHHGVPVRRTYDSLWSQWERFANEHGLPALSATPEGVGLFIASRADAAVSPGYLRQQLSTIERRHADAGRAVADLGGLAREVIDAYVRTAIGPRGSVPLVALGDLRAMAAQAARAGGRYGQRFRVMVCVGYGGAMRPAEMRRAYLENIEPKPWGMLLCLAQAADAPTATEGSGVVVLLRRDDELDPVAALEGLAEVTGRWSGWTPHPRSPLRRSVCSSAS